MKIRDDLGPYEGVDQIEIARNLLTAMQSTSRYNIGLSLQSGTSGVPRDASYAATDAATFGESLAELANVDNGFEWLITVTDNGDGTRTREWRWGYPRIGETAGQYVFQQPGEVIAWQEDIDALRFGTAYQTRGESVNVDVASDSVPLTSTVELAEGYIAAGWPGIDQTIDYSSVSDEETLQLFAAWWANNRGGAARVHQATVRLSDSTSFGPDNLGDYVRIMLVNEWWPIVDRVASFSKSWRVVGMAFKPPQRGAGQEECTLVFEEDAEAV